MKLIINDKKIEGLANYAHVQFSIKIEKKNPNKGKVAHELLRRSSWSILLKKRVSHDAV